MNKGITKKFLVLNLLICFMMLLLVSCQHKTGDLTKDDKESVASVSEQVKEENSKEETVNNLEESNVDEKVYEEIILNYSLIQGEEFKLPSEGVINSNGENINIPIIWETESVDTTVVGNYVYKGINEEYNKKFELYLKVDYKPLTELEVRDITAKAKNALTDIINCLNFDESTMIIEGGRSFAISNIYKSREEVYNALYDYYTDDAIYSFLDNYTLEKDSTFYIIYGQGGVGLSVLDDELDIDQTETTLRAVYTKTISDNWTVTQEYDFIKYENCWIRADITLYP